MHKSSIIAIAGLVAMLSAAAFADPHITKGPYTFEDNAFADRAEPVDPTVVVNDPDDLVPGQPSILLVPAGVGFQQALTGSDLSKGGGLVYGGAVELIFEDNAFFNGDGPDLVLFESGTPEPFQVAIGLGGDEFTAYEFYDTKSLGFSEGGIGINGAAIDLNDFGLDAGACSGVREPSTAVWSQSPSRWPSWPVPSQGSWGGGCEDGRGAAIRSDEGPRRFSAPASSRPIGHPPIRARVGHCATRTRPERALEGVQAGCLRATGGRHYLVHYLVYAMLPSFPGRPSSATEHRGRCADILPHQPPGAS